MVGERVAAPAPANPSRLRCSPTRVPEIGVGQFEPVGTHPDHRRRGLASAVMAAGMDWMWARGLRQAFVGTGYRMEIIHQWAWRPSSDQ